MKTWIIAATVALVGLTASPVRADGIFGPKCTGPACNHKPHPFYGKTQTLPVYLAAPWYLYWPYDAHFLTPAPAFGAYYAPPMMGNYPVQPYFPAPHHGYGYPMHGMQGPPTHGHAMQAMPAQGYPMQSMPQGYPVGGQ